MTSLDEARRTSIIDVPSPLPSNALGDAITRSDLTNPACPLDTNVTHAVPAATMMQQNARANPLVMMAGRFDMSMSVDMMICGRGSDATLVAASQQATSTSCVLNLFLLETFTDIAHKSSVPLPAPIVVGIATLATPSNASIPCAVEFQGAVICLRDTKQERVHPMEWTIQSSLWQLLEQYVALKHPPHLSLTKHGIPHLTHDTRLMRLCVGALGSWAPLLIDGPMNPR
jgi:hypothetical protein